MTWDAARILLDTHFKTLSDYREERTAWPNRTFTLVRDVVNYKIDFIPASNDPEMGGSAHEKGIYQVSIFAPVAGGLGPGLRAAEAVVALFTHQKLGSNPYVQCGIPLPAPYLQEPDWLHLPVSIPFQVL